MEPTAHNPKMRHHHKSVKRCEILKHVWQYDNSSDSVSILQAAFGNINIGKHNSVFYWLNRYHSPVDRHAASSSYRQAG